LFGWFHSPTIHRHTNAIEEEEGKKVKGERGGIYIEK
jgi:hypothetical protein